MHIKAPSEICQTSVMIPSADIPFCQALLFFVEGFPFSFEIPGNKRAMTNQTFRKWLLSCTGHHSLIRLCISQHAGQFQQKNTSIFQMNVRCKTLKPLSSGVQYSMTGDDSWAQYTPENHQPSCTIIHIVNYHSFWTCSNWLIMDDNFFWLTMCTIVHAY